MQCYMVCEIIIFQKIYVHFGKQSISLCSMDDVILETVDAGHTLLFRSIIFAFAHKMHINLFRIEETSSHQSVSLMG